MNHTITPEPLIIWKWSTQYLENKILCNRKLCIPQPNQKKKAKYCTQKKTYKRKQNQNKFNKKLKLTKKAKQK